VPVSGVDTEFVLHDPRVMRKVTVTLPEDVAGWARVRAARDNQSVSRFLGELLRNAMEQESSYETAMQGYLRRDISALKAPGTPYPSRQELHERSLLR